jgi:uncharacterized membrane protein YhaH (DUF805 family)
MKQLIISVFSNSGRFTGRRYFYTVLGLWGALAILLGILSSITPSPVFNKLIKWPIIVIISYGIFCSAVKRLHDMDKSGIFALLLLVPIVNAIFAIVLLFKPGNDVNNKYGESPYIKRPVCYKGSTETISHED